MELPQINVSGTSDVYNYSQIWVFYQTEQEQINAQVNKNNTINTTHWIINADKKLPMTEMLSVMGMIRDKRAKKSIHSGEGMHNYMSYSNPKDQKIQLYKVDSIRLLSLDSLSVNKVKEAYRHTDHLLQLHHTYFEWDNIRYDNQKFQASFFDTIVPKNIRLFVKEDLTYQDYLEKRVLLNTFLKPEIKIDSTEYFIK